MCVCIEINYLSSTVIASTVTESTLFDAQLEGFDPFELVGTWIDSRHDAYQSVIPMAKYSRETSPLSLRQRMSFNRVDPVRLVNDYPFHPFVPSPRIVSPRLKATPLICTTCRWSRAFNLWQIMPKRFQRLMLINAVPSLCNAREFKYNFSFRTIACLIQQVDDHTVIKGSFVQRQT